MTLPRKPRAVVFDLDGTLIDSEALVKEAWLATCGKLGLTLTEAQFLSCVGMHREHNEVQLRTFFGADFPTDTFYAMTSAHVGDGVAPLKPGALELMRALDDMQAPFALATSSRKLWVERHFSAHDLARRFHAVVTRDDVTNGKPDPEPYLKATQMLGHAPGDVLAIEDSHAGVRSASAAGCMTVMIPDLLAANDEMRAKALVLACLDDVRKLLA